MITNFLRNMRNARDGGIYHLIWIILFAVVSIGSIFSIVGYSEIKGDEYAAKNLNGSTIEFPNGGFLSDSYQVVSVFKDPFDKTISAQIKGTVRVNPPEGATFVSSVYNPPSRSVGSNQQPNLNVTWLLADGTKQTQIISDFCTEYREAFVCIEPDLVLPK
jgi:hypothetical protein